MKIRKQIGRALSTALAAFVIASRASAQFEGVVESKNSTIDETGNRQEFAMTMWIKPDKVRIETSPTESTPSTVVIYRKDMNVMWMLNPEERSYFEIPQDAKALDEAPPDRLPGEKARIKKTGEARSILGYPCEQLLISRENLETEIWGTKKLSHLARTIAHVFGAESAAPSEDWNDEIMKMGFFPLASSTKIDGDVAESQEVTKIDPRKLPDELFALPSGYAKHNMNEMLREEGFAPKK